ncbi:MAG TPA: stage III sporulation protein AE [Firmicutes bacterium]|nr:stage III sporulation protein AE [Bacillota bacterium]
MKYPKQPVLAAVLLVVIFSAGVAHARAHAPGRQTSGSMAQSAGVAHARAHTGGAKATGAPRAFLEATGPVWTAPKATGSAWAVPEVAGAAGTAGAAWTLPEVAGIDAVVEEELNHLDLEGPYSLLRRMDRETRELLPEWDPAAWAKGGLKLDVSGMAGRLIRLLWKEVVVNFSLLGKLIILAVVAAVLSKFQQAWNRESLGRLVESVIYLVLMGLVIQSLHFTLNLARGSLDRVTGFIYALLPGIFTLLTAAGGLTLASICHPVVWTGIGLVVRAIKDLVFPLIYFGGIIGLVSMLAEGFSLSKLGGLARKLAIGLLGLLVALFLGVVTIQGISVAVADGVSLRAAKFVTGTFVPLVGSALADSMELAAGCSLLIKNGLGLFGAVAAVLICLHPALKVLAVALIYYLASALVQPAGEERLAAALHEVGNIFLMVFAALAITGLMFFFCLTILTGLGNMTVMIR